MSLDDNKKNIVFVSVSSDLYGSSKLLLTLVKGILESSEPFHPIVCMPLDDGPLKTALKELSVEIIEMPIMLLSRSMLKSFKVLGLRKQYKEAKAIFESQMKGRPIHVLQSNTLVTLFGAIYCRNKDFPHVVHIHEIADRPWFIKHIFGWILSRYADHIVYNSDATQDFYTDLLPKLTKKSELIYNGVDRDRPILEQPEKDRIRKNILNADNELLIGLVGRINRLKGHKVLLESYKNIKEEIPNSKLCFIGSPPDGQDHFQEGVENRIEELELQNDIVLVPYQSEIYPIIDALDLLIVPSTEPESFGIIAVEGMLSNKAVIASNIGGLANVISDGEDGLLVPPSDPDSLGKAIKGLVENSELRTNIESNARQSAIDKFSTSKMIDKFIALYNSIGK